MIAFLILGNDHTGVADDEIIAFLTEHDLDALKRIVQQSGQFLFVHHELGDFRLVQIVTGEQILLTGHIQLILLQILGHFANALHQRT